MAPEPERSPSFRILSLSGAYLVAITAAGVLPHPAKAQNQYVGVKVCASCHSDSHHIWEKSRHAGAYRTLARTSSEKDARLVEGLWIVRMGRGDKYGLPVPAAEFRHCLICHATAAAADPRLVAASLDRKAGVQCEACHGPGSAHARVEALKRSGKPIPAEEVAAALDLAKAVTLRRFASEKEIEALCTKCHDGMCGDFDFQKAWPAVKHSRPRPPDAAASGGARSGR